MLALCLTVKLHRHLFGENAALRNSSGAYSITNGIEIFHRILLLSSFLNDLNTRFAFYQIF